MAPAHRLLADTASDECALCTRCVWPLNVAYTPIASSIATTAQIVLYLYALCARLHINHTPPPMGSHGMTTTGKVNATLYKQTTHKATHIVGGVGIFRTTTDEIESIFRVI